MRGYAGRTLTGAVLRHWQNGSYGKRYGRRRGHVTFT